MLIIRGVNVYPSQVQRSLLSVEGTGVEFVIIVDRSTALDTATVQVEYDPTANPTNLEDFRADLTERVRRRLKNDTNITFNIEILEPETLERAVSKAKRVIDRRQAAPRTG
jgi:phenylacetate-CoA ligase